MSRFRADPATLTPRAFEQFFRSAAVICCAWMGLVLCRVVARLISVGPGARGTAGLIELTAAVNAFWLIAGPALAAIYYGSLVPRESTSRLATVRGITLTAVAALAVMSLEPIWYARTLHAFHGSPMPWNEAVISRGDVNTLLIALILAACWLYNGFSSTLADQRQRAELEAVLVDAELRALTLQLQPHFLFNTLQLAAEAAYDEMGAARRIVRDLQTLLRRSFEFEERSLVRVSEEVDFLQSYVAIQRRRFGSRLCVSLVVDADARDLLLPPLLLQPLVENSIRHGIGPLVRDGRIDVAVRREHGELRIDVRDNGVGFAARNSSATPPGLGLGVTRRRLQALFPNGHVFVTEDIPTGGASVTIIVPAIPDGVGGTAIPLPRATSPTRRETAPSSMGVVALALGAPLFIASVVGALATHRDPASTGRLVTPFVAMWIPFQVLLLALVVVVWRARGVHRWLQQRDVEAAALRASIATMRTRIATIESGKSIMLSALDCLMDVRDPHEFDRRVLDSCDQVRSSLAVPFSVGHVPASVS
ncbi:MAG: histidine kinase [bacterium]